MRDYARFVLRAVCLGAVLLAPPAVAGPQKTVVELFTSQGCSSCPPADALLGELAAREDVIALAFHVDYWNYLGWRDPFSSPAASARQRAYRRTLGLRYVYTPQMVIGGRVQVVGSGREAVLRAIDAQRRRPMLDMRVRHPTRDRTVIRIGAGPHEGPPAAVWLFAYDRELETNVARGENKGVRVVNTNVVRAFRRIGSWSGKATEITISLDSVGARDRDVCAVIVQAEGGGPILGAVTFPVRGAS